MNLKKSARFLREGRHRTNKYILLLGFLCAFNCVQAQVMSITATDPAATEGATGDGITFRVRKSASNVSATSFTVNYSVTGTTTNGTDHTNLTGTVTVPGGTGVTFEDIEVVVTDDDIVENLETLTLTLEPGNGYILNASNSVASADIIDDDIGTFSLDVTDANAAEENQDRGRYVIRLDAENGTGSTVTVPYTISPAATDGADSSDYTTQGQLTFTFPDGGVMARALNIIPVDDSIFEPDETLVLTLGDPSNSQFVLDNDAFEGAVVIADNDCPAGDSCTRLR